MTDSTTTPADQGQQPFAQMSGQAAYETDLATQPRYHDGRPRPSWDKLSEDARWSWERNPTSRSAVATPDENQQTTLALLSSAADYIREVQADFGLVDNGTLADIEAELARHKAGQPNPE